MAVTWESVQRSNKLMKRMLSNPYDSMAQVVIYHQTLIHSNLVLFNLYKYKIGFEFANALDTMCNLLQSYFFPKILGNEKNQPFDPIMMTRLIETQKIVEDTWPKVRLANYAQSEKQFLTNAKRLIEDGDYTSNPMPDLLDEMQRMESGYDMAQRFEMITDVVRLEFVREELQRKLEAGELDTAGLIAELDALAKPLEELFDNESRDTTGSMIANEMDVIHSELEHYYKELQELQIPVDTAVSPVTATWTRGSERVENLTAKESERSLLVAVTSGGGKDDEKKEKSKSPKTLQPAKTIHPTILVTREEETPPPEERSLLLLEETEEEKQAREIATARVGRAVNELSVRGGVAYAATVAGSMFLSPMTVALASSIITAVVPALTYENYVSWAQITFDYAVNMLWPLTSTVTTTALHAGLQTQLAVSQVMSGSVSLDSMLYVARSVNSMIDISDSLAYLYMPAGMFLISRFLRQRTLQRLELSRRNVTARTQSIHYEDLRVMHETLNETQLRELYINNRLVDMHVRATFRDRLIRSAAMVAFAMSLQFTSRYANEPIDISLFHNATTAERNIAVTLANANGRPMSMANAAEVLGEQLVASESSYFDMFLNWFKGVVTGSGSSKQIDLDLVGLISGLFLQNFVWMTSDVSIELSIAMLTLVSLNVNLGNLFENARPSTELLVNGETPLSFVEGRGTRIYADWSLEVIQTLCRRLTKILVITGGMQTFLAQMLFSGMQSVNQHILPRLLNSQEERAASSTVIYGVLFSMITRMVPGLSDTSGFKALLGETLSKSESDAQAQTLTDKRSIVTAITSTKKPGIFFGHSFEEKKAKQYLTGTSAAVNKIRDVAWRWSIALLSGVSSLLYHRAALAMYDAASRKAEEEKRKKIDKARTERPKTITIEKPKPKPKPTTAEVLGKYVTEPIEKKSQSTVAEMLRRRGYKTYESIDVNESKTSDSPVSTFAKIVKTTRAFVTSGYKAAKLLVREEEDTLNSSSAIEPTPLEPTEEEVKGAAEMEQFLTPWLSGLNRRSTIVQPRITPNNAYEALNRLFSLAYSNVNAGNRTPVGHIRSARGLATQIQTIAAIALEMYRTSATQLTHEPLSTKHNARATDWELYEVANDLCGYWFNTIMAPDSTPDKIIKKYLQENRLMTENLHPHQRIELIFCLAFGMNLCKSMLYAPTLSDVLQKEQ